MPSWQDGSETFAIGGATKTSLSVPAGSCGTVSVRSPGLPFCDFDCQNAPIDHPFTYSVKW